MHAPAFLRCRRAVCATLPLVITLPFAGLRSGTTPGVTFTVTMTTEGTNAKGQPMNNTMVAKEQVAGDQARIDWQVPPSGAPSQPNPLMTFMNPGNYWIVSRGASQLTVVDPSKKQYYTMDMGGMMQGVSAMMNSSITDVDISTKQIPGDTVVDGLHTQHFQLNDNHTVKVSIIGITTTSKVQTTSDYYVAPELKSVINPFVQSAKATVQAAGSMSDYIQKLGAAISQMYEGMPVLEITRTTTSDAKNHQAVNTMTRHVTDIVTGDISPTVFVVPSDYHQVQNVLAAGGGGSGNGNSTDSANGSSQSPAKKVFGKIKLP